MQQTLFDKIWDSHIVIDNSQNEKAGDSSGPSLIYVDRHLIHEVTSPQAFAGLKQSGRKVRRPNLTIATTDHNVSTESRSLPIVDQVSKTQLET
ncbi:MAG TPA: aconitase family protein, partial [Nitrososphaeraceae archaeon]